MLVLSLCTQAAIALEANEIFKLADPSVVVVHVSDRKGKEYGLGSGIIIAARDVVTSCHVVENATGIVVKQGGIQRSAKLRYQDAARDLCQIQLDDEFPNGRAVTAFVLSKNVEVGQTVFAIGAPRGLEHTISRGIVSALREMKEEAGSLIQTDAPISPGSSGGGLFDSEGRLIGIVTFQFKDAQNLNFATPADWVQELSKRNRDRLADADAARPAGGAGKPTADAPDAAASELPRVGDRWKYQLIDGKRTVGNVIVEVMDARGKTIKERITRDDERGFVVERNVDAAFKPSRFQAPVIMPGGFQIEEISPYAIADQDLKAGQRWADIPATFQLVQVGKKTLLMQVRVVKQEKVRVPAGEFDATLVEATGKDYFVQTSIKVTCRFWYAAQMMRSVKMSLQVEQSVSTNNTNAETYELVTFEPAK